MIIFYLCLCQNLSYMYFIIAVNAWQQEIIFLSLTIIDGYTIYTMRQEKFLDDFDSTTPTDKEQAR